MREEKLPRTVAEVSHALDRLPDALGLADPSYDAFDEGAVRRLAMDPVFKQRV